MCKDKDLNLTGLFGVLSVQYIEQSLCCLTDYNKTGKQTNKKNPHEFWRCLQNEEFFGDSSRFWR